MVVPNVQHELSFLTTDEVAQAWRVTAATVCRAAARGDIPGAIRRRAGRSYRWLFPRQAVLAQLEHWEPGMPVNLAANRCSESGARGGAMDLMAQARANIAAAQAKAK